MSWAADRRLDYIDRCLTVDGEVTRRRIVEAFGVSPSQAAQDFGVFRKLHPGRMRYRSRRKAYVPVKNDHLPVRDITLDSSGRLVILLGGDLR